ncbi:MAG: FAD:protein FMN transferase [Verrucomicrobia bacterium]|nr:FAD:protein FMN transferase [Verrucomicrobiota bacterium]
MDLLVPHSHRFSFEAMATDFAIWIAGTDPEYARQAAAAAFRELERLESELSRYVETSDIARANRLAEGESLVIGEDALRCLTIAAEVSAATGRAFDPAYASVDGAEAFLDRALFALDPDRHEIVSLTPRLHLDLGAIGKGYALDTMAEVLRDWSLSQACLQSGGSSVLALAAPADTLGWPIGLGDDPAARRLVLQHRALSGSGIAVKGEHLIDVRRGGPATRRSRVWALADDAAHSDALSTAFFIFDDAAIARFCAENPGIGAFVVQEDGSVRGFGAIGDAPE